MKKFLKIQIIFINRLKNIKFKKGKGHKVAIHLKTTKHIKYALPHSYLEKKSIKNKKIS